jgi:hypothetical protein
VEAWLHELSTRNARTRLGDLRDPPQEIAYKLNRAGTTSVTEKWRELIDDPKHVFRSPYVHTPKRGLTPGRGHPQLAASDRVVKPLHDVAVEHRQRQENGSLPAWDDAAFPFEKASGPGNIEFTLHVATVITSTGPDAITRRNDCGAVVSGHGHQGQVNRSRGVGATVWISAPPVLKRHWFAGNIEHMFAAGADDIVDGKHARSEKFVSVSTHR